MTTNQHETNERTRPARHRWVKWFFLLYFGAFAAIALWFGAISGTVTLEISEKTTVCTEPLTSDGKGVDYHEAVGNLLAPPEMKTDENGYRIIVRRLGPALIMPVGTKLSRSEREEKQKRYEKRVYEKLGLDHAMKPDLEFMVYDSYLHEYANANFTDKAEKKAFLDNYFATLYRKSDPSDPVRQAWLQQYGESLDVVADGLNRSVFFSPLVSLNETDPVFTGEATRGDIFRNKNFVDGLAMRFRIRLASGDIDGAVDDAIACQRLGRFTGNSGTMAEAYVANVFDKLGSSLDITSHEEHQPTAKQIRRYLRKVDELPPVPSLCGLVERKHYYGLDLLQKISQGKTTFKNVERASSFMPRISLDWNDVFKSYNFIYWNEVGIYCRGEGLDISYVMLNNIFSREARSQRFAFDFRDHILSDRRNAEELFQDWDLQARLQRDRLETLLQETP